jgi:hypothetical protein
MFERKKITIKRIRIKLKKKTNDEMKRKIDFIK